MKGKRKYLIKGIEIGIIAVFLAAALTLLHHTVKNGRQTESIVPEVTDTPVYVECGKGSPLTVVMQARENVSFSGFQLFLVNISEESTGTLHVVVKEKDGAALLDQRIPVSTVTPGKWFTLEGEVSFEAGREYTLTFEADESEPYFMKLDRQAVNGRLPFEETVFREGQRLPDGISLGVNVVTVTDITLGDVFYYSYFLCAAAAVLLVLLVLMGREKLWGYVRKIPWGAAVRRWGNEVFLLLLFTALCISIYLRAYVENVYISSDSAGYLREAVNLVKGHGFHYDGMAGMDSWFANWPILYPALIALVMLVTGADAYLSSKILAMAVIALILLVLYIRFGKDAWVYALSLTNLGFLQLSYYTWSEIPFLLFLLLFSLLLAKIVREEDVPAGWYLLLGLAGTACFLTRYYGIFVWIVTGLYLLLMIRDYLKERDRRTAVKILRLGGCALVSGVLAIGYLLMNKRMNGMASGVSRTLWWDDYQKLTNDLIQSMLTEFFNVFSLQVPRLIDGYSFSRKALVLVIILVGLVLFVKGSCKKRTTESVLLTVAVSYDVIFIGIRYVSSMDSFYFRFFEPATFLATIGLIGLLLPYIKGKRYFGYMAGAVTAVVLISAVSVVENSDRGKGDSYYEALTQSWEDAYREIPEKSVVIFSDIDFRSSYYRPDVIDGMIYPENTFEDLREIYYGSDYLCIRKEFADTMLAEGEYEESVVSRLKEGISQMEKGNEYIVIGLKEP